VTPAPWSAERTRRRIALDQADSWADEWDRIKPKVPRNARRDHPTFKILLAWLDRLPYLQKRSA